MEEHVAVVVVVVEGWVAVVKGWVVVVDQETEVDH